jgi:hypothetical protein
MASTLISNRDTVSYGVNSYVADTDADVTNLPTDAAPGSTCIVASPISVYILNTKKEWIKL